MGSGVIYAAIVAVWAAVLIPMWLRHHDEINESRSVDRFSRAMRILSRREPAGDRRVVVVPARPSGATGVVRSGGPAHDGDLPRRRPSIPAQRRPAVAPARDPRGARRRSLAVRRRRVLVSLLALTLVLCALVPLSPVPGWAPLAALGLAVAYVVHLRVQARRHADLRRRRESSARSADARMRRLRSGDRVVATRAERLARQAAEARAAAEAARLTAEPATVEGTVADEDGWRPVPVPLPTYVTKPRAPRTTRSIDFGSPEVWTAARQAAGQTVAGQAGADAYDAGPGPVGSPAMPHVPTVPGTAWVAEEGDDELDAILERRRAVGD